jgi:hypothetical protein
MITPEGLVQTKRTKWRAYLLAIYTGLSSFLISANTYAHPISGTVIQANFSKVELATGNVSVVNFSGDNLVSFGVRPGSIIAKGGKVLLAINAAKQLVWNAVNMQGYVVAQRAVKRGGDIVLLANK